MKVIVSSDYHLVFVFVKEDLFVCHVDMFQWVHAVKDDGRVHNDGMKIEEGREEDRERWD